MQSGNDSRGGETRGAGESTDEKEQGLLKGGRLHNSEQRGARLGFNTRKQQNRGRDFSLLWASMLPSDKRQEGWKV